MNFWYRIEDDAAYRRVRWGWGSEEDGTLVSLHTKVGPLLREPYRRYLAAMADEHFRRVGLLDFVGCVDVNRTTLKGNGRRQWKAVAYPKSCLSICGERIPFASKKAEDFAWKVNATSWRSLSILTNRF